MTALLIIELSILLLGSCFALLLMAVLFADERNQSERARIDYEVRLAEAKVHDLTRKMLMAMLDEIQRHRREG
jgi:hypothetical protein